MSITSEAIRESKWKKCPKCGNGIVFLKWGAVDLETGEVYCGTMKCNDPDCDQEWKQWGQRIVPIK